MSESMLYLSEFASGHTHASDPYQNFVIKSLSRLTYPILACIMILPQVGWAIASHSYGIEESPHSKEHDVG